MKWKMGYVLQDRTILRIFHEKALETSTENAIKEHKNSQEESMVCRVCDREVTMAQSSLL
jgi:hypothetical protein